MSKCRSYNITGVKAEVGLSHVVQESKAKKQRNRSLCMTIVLSVSSVIVQLCRHISMLYPSFSFHLYNVCRCCMRLNCCVFSKYSVTSNISVPICITCNVVSVKLVWHLVRNLMTKKYLENFNSW